jgi:Fe-S cluster biogenesis protein NfuA
MELREFIQDFLRKNEWAVTAIPSKINKLSNHENNSGIGVTHAEPKNDLEFKIIQALDEYVKPAVENDGGAIHFKSFKDGKVNVVMRGSCSGCPSSSITLKNGIEQLLKQLIPEVTEVVAEEA